MQLPSIDRTPNTRLASADLASSGANRVIPVAPVNPSVHVSPPLASAPSVINMVNQVPKPNQGEALYTSVSDPGTPGSEAATTPKDWTIHRPAPEKVENPPPKPMSQVLMEHIRSMWNASASAVQVEQVSNQLVLPTAMSITAGEGAVAKQVLVSTPSKIKKTGNI